MKHDLTIIGFIKATKEPISISFSEYPKECTYIHFESKGIEFNLSAEKLKENAILEISTLSSAFGNTLDEFEIILDNDLLCIAKDGNHVRFTSGDTELYYWVCDEFEEASETENILGAIAGYTVNRNNVVKN